MYVHVHVLCMTAANSASLATISQTKLPPQFRSSTSRKGVKLTPGQLLAKKPRVELSRSLTWLLKHKSEVSSLTMLRGPYAESIKLNWWRTSMLTISRLTGLLKMPRPSNSNFFLCLVIINTLGSTKYGVIEDKVVSFVAYGEESTTHNFFIGWRQHLKSSHKSLPLMSWMEKGKV